MNDAGIAILINSIIGLTISGVAWFTYKHPNIGRAISGGICIVMGVLFIAAIIRQMAKLDGFQESLVYVNERDSSIKFNNVNEMDFDRKIRESIRNKIYGAQQLEYTSQSIYTKYYFILLACFMGISGFGYIMITYVNATNDEKDKSAQESQNE